MVFVRAGLMMAALAASLVPGRAAAAPEDCVPARIGIQVPPPIWTVRVDAGTAPVGILPEEFEYAVARAAGIVNENTNAGTIAMGLSTSDAYSRGADLSLDDCTTKNLNYSTVQFSLLPQMYHFVAVTIGTCIDNNGLATQFDILLNQGDAYTLGARALGKYDLVETIEHEFAHSLGLGHPQNRTDTTYPAGLTGQPYDPNFAGDPTTLQNPHYWDFRCFEELGLARGLTAHYATIPNTATPLSAGTFQELTTATNVSQVFGGLGRALNSNEFAPYVNSILNPGYGKLLWDIHDPWLLPSLDIRTAVGPIPFLEPVSTSPFNGTIEHYRRLYFSDIHDYPNDYDQFGVHKLRYLESTDGQAGIWTTKDAAACTSMTGWQNCANSSLIFTGERPSFAWATWVASGQAPIQGEAVMAWVNQDRLDDAHDREIWISVGHAINSNDSRRWNVPFKTGIQSAVSPGIACLAGKGCVIAYVDWNDHYYRIKARRFDLVHDDALGTYRPSFTDPATFYMAPAPVGGADPTRQSSRNSTGSGIAVWYQLDGHAWVGFNSGRVSSNPAYFPQAGSLAFFANGYDADPTSWTFNGLGAWVPSITAPSVVSYHIEDATDAAPYADHQNRLYYAR